MNEKEKKLAERIRHAIEGIWTEYYDEEGIDSGDIAPLEVLAFENYIDIIAELIYKVGEMNKGGNEKDEEI